MREMNGKEVVIVAGPSASGKSHLLKQLLTKKKNKFRDKIYRKLDIDPKKSRSCIAIGALTKLKTKHEHSRKLKKEEWIEDYFLQGACYSVMFEERTGIAVNDIVILIGVDGEAEPQLFVKRRDDYIDLAIHKVRQYEEIHS